MPEVGRKEYVDCRHDLLSALTVSQDRRDRGKANEGKRKMYEELMEKTERQIGDLRETGNHLTAIYKNIKSYNIKHQEKARDILDLAIEEAGNLVPDADVNGIHLQHTENNRVSVVNEQGQNVNLREGCGYRAILGALLRYAALKAQPDALQLILFDEYFFTLSDTTTSAMKDIFLAMKKDMTIICIEQRRNAMDGITDAEYTFKKDLMKNTTVTKTL
jgi:hypothetical protein